MPAPRQLAVILLAAAPLAALPRAVAAQAPPPPVRARALGIAPGIFAPGARNAITDVAGVRVGQVTVSDGDSVRTGVTALLPHAGDLYRDRVPAALHVGNGFGKLLGVTQLRELGELETPLLLTCTLCIWQAGDALAQWMLARPENRAVRSINPVVGETNDGSLNATRARPGIGVAVTAALAAAVASGDGAPVAEGSVGAGHGTVMFGWKGGSAPPPAGSPTRWAATPWGCWCRGTTAGCCRCWGCRWGRCWGATASSARRHGRRRRGRRRHQARAPRGTPTPSAATGRA